MLEYIKQDQNVHFSVFTHHPASGYLATADAQPKYTVRKKDGASITTLINGYTMQTGSMPGQYDGYFYTSGTMFSKGDYCEVSVSGSVAGLTDLIIVKSFKVGDIWDSNVVQQSSVYVDSPYNYFANIKFIKDNVNNQDEYSVNWFKNNIPVPSSNLTNPAISVYKTSDGSAIFNNQKLSFATSNLGVVRYNGSNTLASGEAYLAVTSGTIDGATRVWQNLVGLDS